MLVTLEGGSATHPRREIGKDEETDGEYRANNEVGDGNIQDSLARQQVLDGCSTPPADEHKHSCRFKGCALKSACHTDVSRIVIVDFCHQGSASLVEDVLDGYPERKKQSAQEKERPPSVIGFRVGEVGQKKR